MFSHYLSHTHSQPLIRFRRLEGAHVVFGNVHLLSLLKRFSKFSGRKKPSRSLHPFGLGISGFRQPYPIHYKQAFAFSTFLYPQSHQLALQLAFLEGGLWAYRVSLKLHNNLGLVYPPIVLLSVSSFSS